MSQPDRSPGSLSNRDVLVPGLDQLFVLLERELADVPVVAPFEVRNHGLNGNVRRLSRGYEVAGFLIEVVTGEFRHCPPPFVPLSLPIERSSDQGLPPHLLVTGGTAFGLMVKAPTRGGEGTE